MQACLSSSCSGDKLFVRVIARLRMCVLRACDDFDRVKVIRMQLRLINAKVFMLLGILLMLM